MAGYAANLVKTILVANPPYEHSAIHGFGLSQDRAPADEIPARLDCLALDEVHRAPEKLLQRLLQIREGGKIVAGIRQDGDKEINIAAARIEFGITRSRAEDLQPRHAVPAAERGQSVTLFLDFGPHGGGLALSSN